MHENEYYIQEYIQTRGLKKSTYQSTKLILNHYSQFQNENLHNLLIEADNEEEMGIRWKKRKLKTRLIHYMNFLRENMTLNSAKTYLKVVKSFYSHHEIEIHKLPKMNTKNAILNEPLQYKDLPDREVIKSAVEIAEPLMKALLLFLSSSGMSKIDALSLTVDQFLQATYPFHCKKDRTEAIHTLFQNMNEDMIPTFKFRRQKTNKYFVTFCSHEATREILNYLYLRLKKDGLKGSDKLFKIEQHYFTIKFQELNDALGLGKKGSYNRLRGHMLRKYHASNLEKAGMSRYHVNVLQGKSNNAVDDVYFFEDEETLRREYINHMHSLLIYTETYVVGVDSEEVQLIRKENQELKHQLDEMEEIKSDLEKLKKLLFDL